MKVNKIIIFTDESFPYGMAATNRIISYGKGFVGNGKKTEVICLRRTENADNIRNYKVLHRIRKHTSSRLKRDEGFVNYYR